MQSRVPHILICFLLATCSTSLQSVGPTTTLMKNADTIILHMDDPPRQSYRAAVEYLREYGFEIKRTNSDNLTLTTNRKQAGGPGIDIRLNLSIQKDNPTTIHISGKLYHYTLGNTEIRYPGPDESGPLKSAWDEMLYIAIGFNYEKLMYMRH